MRSAEGEGETGRDRCLRGEFGGHFCCYLSWYEGIKVASALMIARFCSTGAPRTCDSDGQDAGEFEFFFYFQVWMNNRAANGPPVASYRTCPAGLSFGVSAGQWPGASPQALPQVHLDLHCSQTRSSTH